MNRTLAMTVSVAVSVAAGCSSSSSSTGSAACTAYAAAWCGRYSACSNGWYVAVNYGDLATCEARASAQCVARLAVPSTAQSVSGIEACTTALPTETCGDLYGNTGPAACNPPAGKFATGTACAADAQCASAYCAVANDALCGTCQPLPTAGADCSSFACGAGLRCDQANTCASAVADGGACNATSDCELGLSCLSKANICAPAAASGGACDYTGKVGPGCDDRLGLACERMGDGGMCALRALADAGTACGDLNGNGVNTGCLAAGICQKSPPDAGSGACLAAAADGVACSPTVGPDCLPPARCVLFGGSTGTCELPLSASCSATGGTTTGGTTSGGAEPYYGSLNLDAVDVGGSPSYTALAGFYAATGGSGSSCPGTQSGSCCFIPAGSSVTPPLQVSAGTITLSDNGSQIGQLVFGASSYALISSATTASLSWNPGDTIDVSSNGATVSAFSGSGVAPQPISGISPAPSESTPLDVPTSSDLVVTWTPGTGSSSFFLALEDASVNVITCAVPITAGTLTVPSAVLSHLSGSGSIGVHAQTSTSFDGPNASVGMLILGSPVNGLASFK